MPLSSDLLKVAPSADAFARCILDPKHQLSRYPGNNLDTSISHLPFIVDSQETASPFTDDGAVNLYLTGNALEPAFISARSVTVLAPAVNAMRGSQSFSAEVTGDVPFLAPIFLGDNRTALFSDAVSGTVTTRPGYRATVSTAAMTLTVTHPAGLMGSIKYWSRNAALAFTDFAVNITATNTSTNLSIPDGSTAFGLSLASTLPFSGTLTLLANGSGAHTLTVGNHANHCKSLKPDYSPMKVKRARTIGLSAWLRYDGSSLQNSGRTAAVQLSPGVYPTEFPGKTLNQQIMNSGLRGVYTGHFKEGIHAKYIQNAPENYILLDSISVTGLLCMTWTSDLADPQPWTLMCDQVVEFTTDDESRERELARFASPGELAVVIADLNRMQLITSNDAHDYVIKLWNKLKRSAIAVAKSPETWHTIAEVGAGAAAALL